MPSITSSPPPQNPSHLTAQENDDPAAKLIATISSVALGAVAAVAASILTVLFAAPTFSTLVTVSLLVGAAVTLFSYSPIKEFFQQGSLPSPEPTPDTFDQAYFDVQVRTQQIMADTKKKRTETREKMREDRENTKHQFEAQRQKIRDQISSEQDPTMRKHLENSLAQVDSLERSYIENAEKIADMV